MREWFDFILKLMGMLCLTFLIWRLMELFR